MEQYRVLETPNTPPEMVGKILTKEQVIKSFSNKYHKLDDSGIKQLIHFKVIESTTALKIIKLSIVDNEDFHGLIRKDGRRFTPDMKKACEIAVSKIINERNGRV